MSSIQPKAATLRSCSIPIAGRSPRINFLRCVCVAVYNNIFELLSNSFVLTSISSLTRMYFIVFSQFCDAQRKLFVILFLFSEYKKRQPANEDFLYIEDFFAQVHCSSTVACPHSCEQN